MAIIITGRHTNVKITLVNANIVNVVDHNHLFIISDF